MVTKNGILIVEFANQKREQGMDKYEAVVEAANQRLRPILMTSLATSLGALPIALSLGSSASSRVPLGYCCGRRNFIFIDINAVCNSGDVFIYIR